MNLRDEIKCEVGWKKGVSILVVDGGFLAAIVMGRKTGHLPWPFFGSGDYFSHRGDPCSISGPVHVCSLVGKEAMGQI
jgi:hypothetical protein